MEVPFFRRSSGAHHGQIARYFRINHLFEGTYLKHPHSCLWTYLGKDLTCAFQDKIVPWR